jgi:hypothetical protein
MSWNQNSGWGQAMLNMVASQVPVFGNILVVFNSSDSDEANYQHMQDVAAVDPDGLVRFYTTVNAAYDAAESNNNDVILIDGNSSHTLSTPLTITKNRIHFFGMDGGGRLLQQGAKVKNVAGTAAAYVVKNTGTRNSFRNIKFLQTDDEATSLTCFQEGGEGTYFENCSFVIADGDNLDETDAYDFVMGGDSCTFKECTFGLDTLLTSDARAVMMFDQVKAGQEAKNNVFKDCLWQIASSSADANFIRIAAVTDVKFGSVFINPVMLCSLNDSMSAAAIDDAVDSVSSLIEGNFLFVNPATNATEFCTGVSDQMQVVGPAVNSAAGEAVTPA